MTPAPSIFQKGSSGNDAMSDPWLSWSRDQLLWATRGLHWGFRIIVKPPESKFNALTLYEEVFSTSSTLLAPKESQPEFFQVEVADRNGEARPVMAARFLDPDPTHRDAAGRRILHEVLLVWHKGEMPKPESTPADWHLRVFGQLRSEYERIYPLESLGTVDVRLESAATPSTATEEKRAAPERSGISEVTGRPGSQVSFVFADKRSRRHCCYAIGVVLAISLSTAAVAIVAYFVPLWRRRNGNVKSPLHETKQHKAAEVPDR